MSKSFHEIVHYRRAVRRYDPNIALDRKVLRDCLELATLAPNSSNMQLWEFHCVSSPERLKAVQECCQGQNSANTAKALVIFAVTPGKWKQRSLINAQIIREAFAGKAKVPQSVYDYYEVDMPARYGGVGLTEYEGLSGEAADALRKQDVRVIVHKSIALAAMTFMYAMAEAGYDTCPMEGFDGECLKKTLNMPEENEISIVVSCGTRLPDGVYGERKRVDVADVIFEH